MEAAAAALAEREPDSKEEAERAAIFGRPPPPVEPAVLEPSSPIRRHREPGANRPLWESGTMEGRTLAMLRTPGAEVVLERDGWLRISLPDGSYAFAKRETAERVGWRIRSFSAAPPALTQCSTH